MKTLRMILGSLAVLCLFAVGAAHADTYVVRDGVGNLQTFCSRISAGVQYQCPVLYGVTAGGVPVPINIDPVTGNFIVQFPAFPSTDASGTVTAGGTYQTVVAQSNSRHGCLIQNPPSTSENLLVRTGGVSIWTVTPGGSFRCGIDGGAISDLVEVTATTTAHAFTAAYQ